MRLFRGKSELLFLGDGVSTPDTAGEGIEALEIEMARQRVEVANFDELKTIANQALAARKRSTP